MLRNSFCIVLSFLLFIFDTPAYSFDISPKKIENYNLKISRKFSNTYCNSTKFGISKDGALRFSIGETNKEFSNNTFNKYVDYDFLKRTILLNLENNCQIIDFPVNELDKLAFNY